MKKWLPAFFFIIVLLIAASYFFPPSRFSISEAVRVNANENGVFRVLSDSTKWNKWWASTKSTTENKTFNCGNTSYRISDLLYKAVKINITYKHGQLESILHIIPIGNDTTLLSWECKGLSDKNYFHRIIDYRDLREIRNCMKGILNNFKQFAEKKENMYGISLERTSIKDTLLISTKSTSPTYPDTHFIYSLISELKTYAEANSAQQSGNPIYNVTKTNKQFDVMVALPVNNVLPNENGFEFKRMIPGSFIVTTVTGGEGTVNHALQQIHQYFEDYHQTSMAINFEMLITDRSIEPDSTKWITKIYQPVY
jgi:predicted transcriptional regulator YdeE